MKTTNHFKTIIDLCRMDPGLTQVHFCLLIALFYRWQQTRYSTCITITRDDIMALSMIKSKTTYHRCMNFLHRKKYIDYQPSYNPMKGSSVTIFPNLTLLPTNPVQPITSTRNETINNNTHSINIYKDFSDCRAVQHLNLTKNKTATAESRLSIRTDVPPKLNSVEFFFLEKGSSAEEAKKFFNYYSANGWLVGGRSPMHDWKPAAEYWLTNVQNFESYGNKKSHTRAQHLTANTNKDYREKL